MPYKPLTKAPWKADMLDYKGSLSCHPLISMQQGHRDAVLDSFHYQAIQWVAIIVCDWYQCLEMSVGCLQGEKGRA